MVKKHSVIVILFKFALLNAELIYYLNNIDPIPQCINKFNNNFEDTFIFSTVELLDENFQFNTKGTTTIFNNFNISKLLLPYNYFIFYIEKPIDLRNILIFLYGTKGWNSRGYYLIGYFGSDNLDEIFRLLWKYFIYNINVVKVDDNIVNIYTYFPYKNNLCGQYTNYENIGSCSNNFSNLYPSKIPFNLKGCPIRLMAYPMIPYVININTKREKANLAGLEVAIMHVLSQRMNFKEVYLPHNFPYWGYKDLNGTYKFMFGALYENKCDLILGMQFGNASHVIDFDAGFVHLIDGSTWWVPSPLPIPQWKNLTNIFEGNVWLAILIVIIVNGFTWWFSGRNRELWHDYNELTLSIMISLYTLLQGSVRPPDTMIVRLIFMIWLLSCLLIFTAHQSQLISILTSPLYEPKIKSLEEGVNKSFDFGLFIGATIAFQDPNNWVHKALMKRFIECDLSNLCLNQTAFQRNIITIRNYRNVRYSLPRTYTASDGKVLIEPLEFDRLGIWVRFYMTKGFPLLDRINNLLMLMQSNGFIAKLNSDVNFYVLKIESKSLNEPLNVNHLQGAFYILGFGLLIAALVFILEFLFHCYKKFNRISS